MHFEINMILNVLTGCFDEDNNKVGKILRIASGRSNNSKKSCQADKIQHQQFKVGYDEILTMR